MEHIASGEVVSAGCPTLTKRNGISGFVIVSGDKVFFVFCESGQVFYEDITDEFIALTEKE